MLNSNIERDFPEFVEKKVEFQEAVKNILGNEIKVTTPKFCLGNNGFFILFYHKNVKVTHLNSNIATSLTVTQKRDDLFEIDNNFCYAKDVKFRKITAKNSDELLKKLLKWITKYTDTFIEQAKEENIKDIN